MELVPHTEIEQNTKPHYRLIFLLGIIVIGAIILLLFTQIFPSQKVETPENAVRLLSPTEIMKIEKERERELAATIEANGYPQELPADLIFSPGLKATVKSNGRTKNVAFNLPSQSVNDTIDIYIVTLESKGWQVEEKLGEPRIIATKNSFVADISFSLISQGVRVSINYEAQ